MFSRRTGWNLAQNRYSEAVARFRASGRPLLDLTASNPTQVQLDSLKSPALLASLPNPAALDYCPDPRGIISAREAVCRYYRERGDAVIPEQLVLTTSTSEGYSFVFRLLCNPGDEVLVPSPSYPLFEFLADLQDVRLVPYPLFYDHGWHVDLPTLRDRITERTRAAILVHPNNPTGSYVKASEARAETHDEDRSTQAGPHAETHDGDWPPPAGTPQNLNAICSDRGIALIVDEVFLDFAHPGSEGLARSFVSNRDALTFTLSGLSKIGGLPQMKFAWIATSGPDEQAGEALSRLEVIADTFLSMNAPIQLAAPAFFESRYSFQRELKRRIGANLTELDRQLSGQNLCSRLEIEAGWYAVLRVPATGSDEDLAIRLLEQEGVLVHPGHFYDFRTDGYLVVSLIAPKGEFRKGIGRLIGLLT